MVQKFWRCLHTIRITHDRGNVSSFHLSWWSGWKAEAFSVPGMSLLQKSAVGKDAWISG